MKVEQMCFFYGIIVENYSSNLVGDGKTVTVVEADGLIVLFLHLLKYACITSMDADHLDVYGSSDAIKSHCRICK
jgi:UDP-N-acetylmuramate--alanine ligase